MNASFSADALASEVNLWCQQHGVVPASGQAGEKLTERSVRYYRTLGLLDPPLSGAGAGFGEKHRLQLIAMRLLQAQGLPLNRIRDLLFGRSIEELREIEKRGVEELRTQAPVALFRRSSGQETWSVTPLDDEFMIISRSGRNLPGTICERLRKVLSPPEVGKPEAAEDRSTER